MNWNNGFTSSLYVTVVDRDSWEDTDRIEIMDGKARLTLTEGKTHEVRRIFAKWERPVATLKRISLGTLTLDDSFPEGNMRELTEDEINGLKALTGLT